jgi:hypothetical protein
MGVAPALWLSVGREVSPNIVSARDNVFVNNDIGVKFSGLIDPGESEFRRFTLRAEDAWFGTSAVPGNNDFHCNRGKSGLVGYDVRFDTAVDGGATMPFAGNTWLIAPPRVVHEQVNGAEIVVAPGKEVSLDISDAARLVRGMPGRRRPLIAACASLVWRLGQAA